MYHFNAHEYVVQFHALCISQLVVLPLCVQMEHVFDPVVSVMGVETVQMEVMKPTVQVHVGIQMFIVINYITFYLKCL